MTTFQIIKRFFEPALQNKKNYIGLLCLVSARPLEGIVITLLLNKATQFLELKNQEYFFITLGIYLARIVVYQLYNYLMRNFSPKAYRGFQSFLNPKYLKTYIGSDNNQIESIGTGRMISLIDKGIDVWTDLLMQSAWMGSYAIIQLLFVGYLLRRIHWSFPLILISLLLIMICLTFVFVKGGNYWRAKRIDSTDECSRHNVKIYMSKFEILINSKIDQENKKLEGLIDQAKYYDTKKLFYEHIGFNVSKVIMYIVTLGLFYYLGYKYFNYSMINFSDIVLYLGLINALDSGTRYTIDLYKSFAKNFQRVEKLRKTFDSIKQISGLETGKDILFKDGLISLSHISYGYDPSLPIFSDFSLSLNAKKKTALVGPSGGGKSTLIKLIAGYLRPDSGDVIIDNQKLSEVSLVSYYKHIGYLTQEPSVFDGTVRENLEYGIVGTHRNASDNDNADILPHVPTADLHQVITLAKCERIYDLPQGLDTEIGERGVRLSGGQKQRLAIAKIMLKNPEIILLDEPTSALDSYNEEQVTLALNNLFKDKTVIVIAHRLQTVKHADEIIYIGRDALHASADINVSQILERGNHEELLAMKGEYYKMVELQSGF